jgi:CoA:oxalate CoA-transferase
MLAHAARSAAAKAENNRRIVTPSFLLASAARRSQASAGDDSMPNHDEPPRGPLSGVRVLDLTRVLAGPFCTTLLWELGAEVLKIERPGHGDDTRAFPPFQNGESVYFASINRGKRSIALDLRAPEDRETFERLLAKADVLIENFRPGTMERLGYDWDKLKTFAPQLIYARVSGFGQTGPYRDRRPTISSCRRWAA